METYLSPIEKPSRLMMKLVYFMSRDKQMRPETFARLAKHFSERQICEIAWLVATEHYYNIMNIGLNIHSDMLCEIGKTKK